MTAVFNSTFPSLYPFPRRHLLVSTARAEGYSKLMLGENCTRLAVKLLANIALGRGAQLAVDTVRGGYTKFIIHPTLSC